MSQPLHARELGFIRDAIAKGGGVPPEKVVLNSKAVTVPDAKPQQDRFLKESILDVIFTGEKLSQSRKSKRALVGWERGGRTRRFGKVGRKFDGFRGFVKLFWAHGAKQVEIRTANGDCDKDLQDLVDLENIPEEVFKLGFEFVGELVMFVGDKEMGFAGFATGKAIINYAREYVRGYSPVKFCVKAFHAYKLGADFYFDCITDPDDDDIKQNFMKAVFKDSRCISVVDADYFQIGEGGAVYLNSRQVVEHYDRFAGYLKRLAEKDGLEGYVVSFDRSFLHFEDNSKPTYVDYGGKHRTKNAAKCKTDFTFLMYIWRNPDGTVSLSDSAVGAPIHTLAHDMCLADLPKDGSKKVANVTCSWVNLTHDKPRPLLDIPWTPKVTKVSLNGVHQIKQEDLCLDKVLPPKVEIVAKKHPHYNSVVNAIHEAKKLAMKKIGMYKSDGTRSADPDYSKATRLFESVRDDKSMTKYPTKSSAKAGPITVRFGPGSEESGPGDGAGGGSLCAFSCKCKQITRKPEETAKMFVDKKFHLWEAGYEKGDCTRDHMEAMIGHMGGVFIDPLVDKSVDFVVVPCEETPTTKSFVQWYKSLEGDKPKVILSYWLCNCNFLNAVAPSLSRATVEVPEVFAIEDVYEVGKPLSSWGKKAYLPPRVCTCPPPKHKRVVYVREGDDPTKCKTCPYPKVIIDPLAKKPKISTGFDHQVIHVWGEDDITKTKIEGFKGIVYTPDHDRCDIVFVNDDAMAVSGDMLKWLARFAVIPSIYKIDGLHDCITKELSTPQASFKLTSRV